jgi:hypothetical protein
MALWSNTDTTASKPKYLSDTLINGQAVTDKAATIGVSADEALNEQGQSVGINTAGWVMTRSYTETVSTGLVATLSTGTGAVTLTTGTTAGLAVGMVLNKTSGTGAFGTFSSGATVTILSITNSTQFVAAVNHATGGSITFSSGYPRRKSETLVAMGSMTGDNDTLDPDPVVTITVQPVDVSVVAPATATFSVTATATRGATLGYSWERSDDGGSTWTVLTPITSTSATYTTAATVVGTDNADKYRVKVQAVGSAQVTSSVVTLTVT